MTTRWGRLALLTLAMLASGTGSGHAWFWDEPPEVTPPPVHVYDYTRGPVWTANGWAYVPVEVHFPRVRPPVLAGPLPPPGVPPVALRRPPPPPDRYPNMLEPLPKLPPVMK